MKAYSLCLWSLVLVWLAGWPGGPAAGAEPGSKTWLPATAYVVPKETATEGEGYFSIIEGLNRRLYVGTHANGVNSWLVEFDPAQKKMKVVVDAHKAIGIDLRGLWLSGQDPHAQQRRRQRQGLLRHQAGLSRYEKGRETRGLPGRLPHGLRPGHGQDQGLSHPRAAPRHQQHHPRRVARHRLHLHLLRRPAWAR